MRRCSANPKPNPNPNPNPHQVLGPLQNIINDDRAAREKVAMQKQLHQEQAGLKSVTRKDLEIVGLAVEMDHGQLVLVKHSQGQEYTLKAISKNQAVERSLQVRVRVRVRVRVGP